MEGQNKDDVFDIKRLYSRLFDLRSEVYYTEHFLKDCNDRLSRKLKETEVRHKSIDYSSKLLSFVAACGCLYGKYGSRDLGLKIVILNIGLNFGSEYYFNSMKNKITRRESIYNSVLERMYKFRESDNQVLKQWIDIHSKGEEWSISSPGNFEYAVNAEEIKFNGNRDFLFYLGQKDMEEFYQFKQQNFINWKEYEKDYLINEGIYKTLVKIIRPSETLPYSSEIMAENDLFRYPDHRENIY